MYIYRVRKGYFALECGFSSHSPLSKQFRQVTGMTPKAYRTNI
ncbi:MAG: helix-turn-helix transcriptional regulator [Synechococcaceae cyanobacterium SM2_3_1]|nr:helix-turn-helix transcriptional regulator [Synechococcaceae cyanobacterium SM2_3_1]